MTPDIKKFKFLSSALALRAIFFFFLLPLLEAGCVNGPQMKDNHSQPHPFTNPGGQAIALSSPTIFTLAQDLAAQLRSNLRNGSLQDWPCIITTLVNIDNLHTSSSFGRVLAEAVGSEVFRQGGDVKEVRTAKALYVKPSGGEMILSRRARQLAQELKARAAITGTYAIGSRSVVINMRMIDLYSGNILSVAQLEVGRTPTVNELLGEPVQENKKGPEPTSYDSTPL